MIFNFARDLLPLQVDYIDPHSLYSLDYRIWLKLSCPDSDHTDKYSIDYPLCSLCYTKSPYLPEEGSASGMKLLSME
jgi:hypothetical protein